MKTILGIFLAAFLTCSGNADPPKASAKVPAAPQAITIAADFYTANSDGIYKVDLATGYTKQVASFHLPDGQGMNVFIYDPHRNVIYATSALAAAYWIQQHHWTFPRENTRSLNGISNSYSLLNAPRGRAARHQQGSSSKSAGGSAGESPKVASRRLQDRVHPFLPHRGLRSRNSLAAL